MESKQQSTNFFDSASPAADGEAEASASSTSGSESEKSSDGEDGKGRTSRGVISAVGKDAESMLSPLEAFAEIEGPPEFLDPEAIRPSLTAPTRKRKPTTHSPKAEKKPCPIVIAAKAVTYETPRVPETTSMPQEEEQSKGGASKAMAVDEFLTKGGGAMLPRKTRLQRDKEKLKREKGQSSHSTWKSEEEMLLRQQFDS